MKQQLLDEIPEGKVSLENDMIPKCCQREGAWEALSMTDILLTLVYRRRISSFRRM